MEAPWRYDDMYVMWAENEYFSHHFDTYEEEEAYVRSIYHRYISRIC